MTTKLVYVLTCDPEKNFIEQALMSVYSARYWNPEAHIVLITDNDTNSLLIGKRGEIRQYVSELKVIQFSASHNMMYRSRWLKTRARDLVEGDFLFIDCDTICQKTLEKIDYLECEVGAVYESHLPVESFCDSLFEKANAAASRLGVDLTQEQYYYSSGVIYVKDTCTTHELYKLWYKYWLEGNNIGIHIDQPALAKANRDSGHIIEHISDTYNCILFTRNPFTEQAHILHITTYMNPCLLFMGKALEFVKEHGIASSKWIQKAIINPCDSFFPFDYNVLNSSITKRIEWVIGRADFMKGYGENVDNTYSDLHINSRSQSVVKWCFTKCMYIPGVVIWMLFKRMSILKKKRQITDNICRV